MKKRISNAALLTVNPFLFLLTKIRFIGVICFAAGFVGIIAFSILLIYSIMGLKKIKTEGKEL